jgi:hypothetical protein
MEKEIREKVGGMDERLIRNQDLDLGLRMSKMGFPALKENYYWGIHHTVSYLKRDRLKYFFRTKALLATGVLMRKHLFNFTYIRTYPDKVFYVALLFLTIAVLFLNPFISLILLIFYIVIQLYKAISANQKEGELFRAFIFRVLFNIYTLIGLLFYFPGKPSYQINKVRNK